MYIIIKPCNCNCFAFKRKKKMLQQLLLPPAHHRRCPMQQAPPRVVANQVTLAAWPPEHSSSASRALDALQFHFLLVAAGLRWSIPTVLSTCAGPSSPFSGRRVMPPVGSVRSSSLHPPRSRSGSDASGKKKNNTARALARA